MRRSLKLALTLLLAMALPGCFSMPGTVKFVKHQSGVWEATEVTVPSEGITPSQLKDLEDFLNRK